MTYPLDRMVEASKRFGLKVEVVPGAESRSAGSFNPFGFVGHHTGGPATGVRPSLAVCVNGRSDLPGPLCNDFLDRDGVDVIVACGRANHAGLGAFRGILGNSGVWGTEAEDDGDGTWTPAQLDAYPRLVAARLWLLGRDESWYCSHRTWALEPPSWPGRKTDPEGITDTWMRSRVAPLLAAGSAGANPLEDDLMTSPISDENLDAIAARVWARPLQGELSAPEPAGAQLVRARLGWAIVRDLLPGVSTRAVNIAAGVADLQGRPAADVDEAALAEALAPLLTPSTVATLAPDTLAAIAKTVTDEQARRLAPATA